MDDKPTTPLKEPRRSMPGRPEAGHRPHTDGHEGHADAFWPILVEFALSQRTWWIGICEDFDLTPMQGHALRSLDPDRPVAMSVLAEALICDASNVTGIVDKMESRGLIVRQSAENDRRIKIIAVTPKGRELRERLSARLLEPPAAIAAMPPEVRRQLAEVLRAVVTGRNGTPPAGA